jgi:UDP-glucose 4-epimerase
MELAGTRVFLTGGAGFIGSHLVRDLIDAGSRVTVYDNFSTGSRDNLADVEDHIEVVEGDILDLDNLRRAMEGHAVVSHHAAQLEITKSIGDPIFDLTTNTIGTLNVLRAIEDLGITRLVEASSAGVYGQATADLQHESDPTEPNWEYGVSKLACEKYAAIACERNPGLSVASLRYAIVYGEREWFGRVLTIFLQRALRGEPPVIFGDGGQERDFVYVGDIASLHRRCLEAEYKGHLTLNGSTGIGTTVSELADHVCSVAGLAREPVFDDVAEGARSELADGRMRLPSELRRMRMGFERAEQLLGWRPVTPLADGLAREWKWISEHPERWTEMSY